MLDTNQIQTALETANNTAGIMRAQMSPWLPAIAVAAAWLGRELNRLAAWSTVAADRIIARGGLLKIALKLFWAPDTTPSPGGRGQGEGELH